MSKKYDLVVGITMATEAAERFERAGLVTIGKHIRWIVGIIERSVNSGPAPRATAEQPRATAEQPQATAEQPRARAELIRPGCQDGGRE